MARWSGRRRRKPRVVWLQNTGTELGTSRAVSPYDNASATEFAGQVDTTGGTVVSIPLVLDVSPKREFVGSTLPVLDNTGLNSNLEYGYRLRRIIGKYALAFRAIDSQAPAPAAVWVKLGLMVRKVNTETGNASAGLGQVDPSRLAQVSDPWIWQRNHYFRNFGGSGFANDPDVFNQLATQFQNSTQEVGGTKDGPALDVKTARRVAAEERLFLDISVQCLSLSVPAGVTGSDNCFMYFLFDYRVLGTILTNVGNRRNASR